MVHQSIDRKRLRRQRSVVCKCCGCSLSGVRPVAAFSTVYDRMCPERDGDFCERTAP